MLCFCSNGHIVPVQMDTVCMILLDIERYRGHKLTSHLHSLVSTIDYLDGMIIIFIFVIMVDYDNLDSSLSFS